MAGPDLLHAQAWLEVYELLDLQLSPLGQRAIELLDPRPSDRIVDVGCGAGQTLLQLADRVGADGQIIGVDIAPLLLDRARARAAGFGQVRFAQCDAARLILPEKSIDCVFSRFGVMRFEDPVAVFSNFHGFMKPSGKLSFVCWRALAENELDLLPIRAAGLENRADHTPFRFQDPAFTRAVLAAAGFSQILIQPHDQAVSSGGLEDTLQVLLRIGAVGKIVRENPELREPAEHRLRAALAPKLVQGQLALNAATWMVTATA